MPSLTELAITLVAMVGLALLVSEKGDKIWACVIAVVTWLLVEFTFVLLGFLTAWYGLVD